MMNICFFLSMALGMSAQQLPSVSAPGITVEQSAPAEMPMETVYYVMHNGVYEEADLSETPEFITGDESMALLLQLNIRYPDAAREKKIGGTVRVSVVLNEEGEMEDAFIHEGIGGGCNDEALRAVKLLDTTGFTPARVNGKAVSVMFDIPITFLPR